MGLPWPWTERARSPTTSTGFARCVVRSASVNRSGAMGRERERAKNLMRHAGITASISWGPNGA